MVAFVFAAYIRSKPSQTSESEWNKEQLIQYRNAPIFWIHKSKDINHKPLFMHHRCVILHGNYVMHSICKKNATQEPATSKNHCGSEKDFQHHEHRRGAHYLSHVWVRWCGTCFLIKLYGNGVSDPLLLGTSEPSAEQSSRGRGEKMDQYQLSLWRWPQTNGWNCQV